MKILITNITLIYSGGSQLYTLDLASYLSEQGHEVVVFSPSLGPIAQEISKLKNVIVTNNLEQVKLIKFDVLHIHHNVNAYLVREYFPDVPALMVIHGVLPEYEQPPQIDLGISKYIAVSQEVKEYMIKRYDIPESQIVIIHNWVNADKFKKKSDINEIPKRILVVSNHYPEEHRKIYETVCKRRGLDITHVGLPDNSVTNVEDYMNNADIVITLGRGAMEAMSLGRNVIVSDIYGMDGMLNSKVYLESVKNNLSGRRYRRKVTEDRFETELDKYSFSNGITLQTIVKENHNREKNIRDILKQYKIILSSNVTLDENFKKVLTEMKVLSRQNGERESLVYTSRMENKHLEEENKKYRNELEIYKRSKIFKLAQRYWGLRDKILKKRPFSFFNKNSSL